MEEEYTRRLSVSRTIPFDCEPAELWKVISAPGILEACHPFCKTNTVQEWNEEGHLDTLVYLNNRTYIRQFQTWSKGKGFTLSIGSKGGPQSYVVWEIEPRDTVNSQLTITVYPFILEKLPRFFAFIPHHLWVRRLLRSYLMSVLLGFEHHIRTGNKVPRNHFGKHPWFS